MDDDILFKRYGIVKYLLISTTIPGPDSLFETLHLCQLSADAKIQVKGAPFQIQFTGFYF